MVLAGWAVQLMTKELGLASRRLRGCELVARSGRIGDEASVGVGVFHRDWVKGSVVRAGMGCSREG